MFHIKAFWPFIQLFNFSLTYRLVGIVKSLVLFPTKLTIVGMEKVYYLMVLKLYLSFQTVSRKRCFENVCMYVCVFAASKLLNLYLLILNQKCILGQYMGARNYFENQP